MDCPVQTPLQGYACKRRRRRRPRLNAVRDFRCPSVPSVSPSLRLVFPLSLSAGLLLVLSPKERALTNIIPLNLCTTSSAAFSNSTSSCGSKKRRWSSVQVGLDRLIHNIRSFSSRRCTFPSSNVPLRRAVPQVLRVCRHGCSQSTAAVGGSSQWGEKINPPTLRAN
ncbi:hypothetical protein IWZ00DRAFT_60623 [Phyllosticta capitalensis]